MILCFPNAHEFSIDYNVNAEDFKLCYKYGRTVYFHQGELRSEYYQDWIGRDEEFFPRL